jgi:hypothetical protein
MSQASWSWAFSITLPEIMRQLSLSNNSRERLHFIVLSLIKRSDCSPGILRDLRVSAAASLRAKVLHDGLAISFYNTALGKVLARQGSGATVAWATAQSWARRASRQASRVAISSFTAAPGTPAFMASTSLGISRSDSRDRARGLALPSA